MFFFKSAITDGNVIISTDYDTKFNSGSLYRGEKVGNSCIFMLAFLFHLMAPSFWRSYSLELVITGILRTLIAICTLQENNNIFLRVLKTQKGQKRRFNPAE